MNMKNKYIFIFFAALSAVFACEQIDESSLGEKEIVEKVEMVFSAVIEKDQETKTVLVDGENANIKKVFWQPEDAIGVSAADGGQSRDEWYGNWYEYSVGKFSANIDDPAATADFNGSINFSSSYKAFYPYTETIRDSSGWFIFDHPSVQKYVNGSFDPNVAPMVATAKYGETFEFKNICGILELKLTGAETVESIVFSGIDNSGNQVAMSGQFEVDSSADEPIMKPHWHSSIGYSVTLDCGQPVQLDPTVPTSFYMILPPAAYASFSVMIKTEKEVMLKSGKNLTITRSHIKPTAELEYVESVYYDLSAKGTANSYIVSEPGLYSFDATVIGNGVHGYVTGESFYPATPEITPVGVKLLWEDKNSLISGLDIKDGKVVFMYTGQEGNAQIAVTDASDNILWSWHLWLTDQPSVQVYKNDKGTFEVLDRNLGATRADRGSDTEWRDSRGLLYQWGRKDPFSQSEYYSNYSDTRLYLDEIVEDPRCFIRQDRWTFDDSWSSSFWSLNKKTIYDPCPVGYKVAASDIWDGFVLPGKDGVRLDQLNVSGTFNYGWEFYINDNKETAWYPANNVLWYYNWGYTEHTNAGYIWSVNSDYWNTTALSYHYNDTRDMSVNRNNSHSSGHAFAVRCMKDDGYVDTSLPQLKMASPSDVTTTSLTLNAEVTYGGWNGIIERGFIWGSSEDLADGETLKCDSGSGLFSYTLENLTPGGAYYVKAYATNEYGTAYTQITRVGTRYTDNVENLSAGGTANSYMVKPKPGSYSFDARVKGNSINSISPVKVDVLWETNAFRDKCENIVDNVRLSDGWILFEVPADVQTGNALIAVKDASGTILWSWHIWVVDYNPATQYHTYVPAAESKPYILMDRPLGAAQSEPDYNNLDGTWELTTGMLYQWGRKDPLIYDCLERTDTYRFESVQESIEHPLFFAQGEYYWVYPFDYSLWSNTSKTMYDPCPAGWRVPGSIVYAGMSEISRYNPYGILYRVNNQRVWFGYGDYIHSQAAHYVNNGSGYYWTSDIYNNENGTSLYYDGGYYSGNNYYTDAYPVRCMKDE